MGLNFNLSSNSSILNKWSSTTVAFAGLVVETPVPSPVIRTGTLLKGCLLVWGVSQGLGSPL